MRDTHIKRDPCVIPEIWESSRRSDATGGAGSVRRSATGLAVGACKSVRKTCRQTSIHV